MTMTSRQWLALPVLLAATFCSLAVQAPRAADDTPATSPDASSGELCILVTDPLAKENACACVAGFAQRRYEALALVLKRRLGRPCAALTGTKLSPYWDDQSRVHLIIGKHSEVLHQARRLGRKVQPIASLTNKQGETTFQGLFVVRNGNAARTLADLDGYEVILGPEACDEKNAAAIDALKRAGVQGFTTPSEPAAACTDAAGQLLKRADGDRVVAVISDYARVLLEGCGSVPPGALRVVGRTDPLPFIAAFATEDLPVEQREAVRTELLEAGRFKTLLKLLETKDGFQPFAAARDTGDDSEQVGWTDFRGPYRNGLAPTLPATLDRLRPLWNARLDDQGLGGVAATKRWVVVTDRDPTRNSDYLKIFNAATGQLAQRANLVRPAGARPDKALDYGNSIRSTPVIRNGRIHVLDAYGTLFRGRLPDGSPGIESVTLHGLRTESMVDDYELATWGVASTPLILDDALIVNVCGKETTLLALELGSSSPRWRSPGAGTGYASCITGTFGGRTQIVAYQAKSFSGWDAESGKLLWNVQPEVDGDFNVPTPIAIGEDRLLVVTENNGMRLHEFNAEGTLSSQPIAINEDIHSDTVTPVVVGGYAYCTSGDQLLRADIQRGLAVDWSISDDALMNHVSLIADVAGERLLVVAFSGELLLFDISGDRPQLRSRRSPFLIPREEAVYSHPAIVGGRLYLRGINTLTCVAL